jgi:hypothetical protein
MIYKGYELMKAVSEGKLNLEQKVSTTSLGYKNCTIEFVLKDIAFNIMDLDFELIEDEIDIDNMKEMELDVIDDVTYYINDLIKAVKQIDKRVKRLEEK